MEGEECLSIQVEEAVEGQQLLEGKIGTWMDLDPEALRKDLDPAALQEAWRPRHRGSLSAIPTRH